MSRAGVGLGAAVMASVLWGKGFRDSSCAEEGRRERERESPWLLLRTATGSQGGRVGPGLLEAAVKKGD